MNECNKIGENTTNLLLRDIHFWPYHNITPLSTITETTRNILNWMITSKFRMNSIPAFFTAVPDISKNQLKKIISLGYNPVAVRYAEIVHRSDTCAIENHKKDSAKYSSIYTKFDKNLWFSFNDTEDTCGKILKKFTTVQGIRIPEEKNIGQGGFGKVFEGQLKGSKIAAKVIDVTDGYRKWVQNITSESTVKNTFGILTGNLTSEAAIQGQLKHKNILPVIEHWIQCQNLKKISLVIATPLCIMNLQEWLEDKQFVFNNVKQYMIQICDALFYLASENVIHRDVKLSNILVKSETKVLLADFGLVNTNGLTPIYCAPEQVTQSSVAETDIYGLGVTILLSFFEVESGLQLLFSCAKDGNYVSVIVMVVKITFI